MEKSDQS